MLGVFLILAFLIVVNALYVAAEFASVAARRTRIETLALEGHRLAARLLPHLQDAAALDRYVAACQIGITASSLVLGAYGQERLASWVRGPLQALGLQGAAVETTATVGILVFLTGLQVVLGELLPKSLAIRNPERMALALAVPMDWSLRLLSWFIWLLNGAGNVILRLLRAPTQAHRYVHSPEELEHLLAHGSRAGELHEEERRQLGRVRRVLRFAERRVRDFMVPRADVVVLRLHADEPEVLRETLAHPFTRFPVYGDGPDDVRGVVHVSRGLAARSTSPPCCGRWSACPSTSWRTTPWNGCDGKGRRYSGSSTSMAAMPAS